LGKPSQDFEREPIAFELQMR